jgi:hypothetical protein
MLDVLLILATAAGFWLGHRWAKRVIDCQRCHVLHRDCDECPPRAPLV